MQVETKKVKLSDIKVNPDNPRQIDKVDMDRLIKSLQEFPEMMQLREIVVDDNYEILGGNMRYLALKTIGEAECIAKIVTGLTPEQKREFVIKDNSQFGSWDMDLLANGWDDLPLVDWGVDIPKAWEEPLPEEEEKQKEPEEPQVIVCPKCGHEFSILKERKE